MSAPWLEPAANSSGSIPGSNAVAEGNIVNTKPAEDAVGTGTDNVINWFKKVTTKKSL